MLLKEYLRLALTLPPHVTARKGAALLRRQFFYRADALRSRMQPTYASLADTGFEEPRLTPLFPSPTVEELLPHREDILFLATRACRHEFNLLGSGWVKVEHGMDCKGLEGHRYVMPGPSNPREDRDWLEKQINRVNRQDALSRYGLIDGPYAPIDWQLDFKSGYRWSSLKQSHAIRYGHVLGADVKVPWELARMQHLPQLAWAYQLARSGERGFGEPEIYLREFRNQVLDFAACNPPNYGVNWTCTMDVAIRVSNWLITWDFFVTGGAEFPTEFETAFFRSIYDHGRFIVNHLEWSEDLRSNHYLSDIAGLLFVSGYLPESEETNAWLALSLNELARETPLQFNPDGSNFEASTCYHRLSGEVVLYSTALAHLIHEGRVARSASWNRISIRHRGPKPLPPQSRTSYSLFSNEHQENLGKIAAFTLEMTMPDGNVCQIGDNDSGRFLKLQPALTEVSDRSWPEENSLDHAHFISATAGFLNRDEFKFDRLPLSLDQAILAKVRPRRNCASPQYIFKNKRVTGKKLCIFDDFGVFVYRNKEVYCAFRCGSVGQNGNGGHAHNDQLSFSAAFRGTTFFIDPGSYLYTPSPQRRNAFRSTIWHNTLSFDEAEQCNWIEGSIGLFNLISIPKACMNRVNESVISGECIYRKICHRRTIYFAKSSFTVVDEHNQKNAVLHLPMATGVTSFFDENKRELLLFRDAVAVKIEANFEKPEKKKGYYSAGYGLIKECEVLEFVTSRTQLIWTVSIEEYPDDAYNTSTY